MCGSLVQYFCLASLVLGTHRYHLQCTVGVERVIFCPGLGGGESRNALLKAKAIPYVPSELPAPSPSTVLIPLVAKFSTTERHACLLSALLPGVGHGPGFPCSSGKNTVITPL